MRLMLPLAIMIVAAPAVARGGDIASAWRIGPIEAIAAERTARTGDILWKQPLEAGGLVTLAAPATAADGRQILASGTEMMKMAAGDAIIFCEATPRKASFAEQMLIGYLGETAGCLIDADTDKSFDGFFTKKVQYEGFPVIRGGFPDKPKPLRPLPYEVRERGSGQGGYWMGIRYLTGDRETETQRFQIVFGGRDSKSNYSDLVVGPKSALPRRVEYRGGAFTILGFEKGTMRYRIDSPLPDQPFSVVRVITVTTF